MDFEFKKIKNMKFLIPILLLIVALSFSTYFRMQPSSLPITDNWANDYVNNYYQQTIQSEINNNYPHLPQTQKNALIMEEFNKIPQEELQAAKNQVSNDYKSRMKDENGDTYLLAIDPYLWWHYTENFVEFGTTGNKNVNGMTYDTLRDGRIDREEGFRLHSGILFLQHKILSAFSDISVMHSVFLFPPIFIGISIILIFFMTMNLLNSNEQTKKFASIGAFFTSMFVAINTSLFGRTPAGFSDTDTYNIFCPVLILFFLFNAFYTNKTWKKIVYSSIAGLGVVFYNLAWGGWWYMFDFIIGMFGIYLVYLLIKKNFSAVKNLVMIGTIFFFSYLIPAILLRGFNSAIRFLKGPLWAITFKNVGTTTIWPNVLTTVAEFNTQATSKIVSHMGGTLIFAISLLGLFYLYKIDKKYLALLSLWYVGGIFSFTQGMRFAILLVPAVGIAFGVGIVFIVRYGCKLLESIQIKPHFSKIIIFVILLMVFLQPLQATSNQALHEVPSMNDAWWNSLKGIEAESNDAIITSWWDFGHWFTSVSNRRVTFDGGDQGKRIHWVGKILLTSNESEAINILRMLNCGQNTYYENLIEVNELSEKEAIDKVYDRIHNSDFSCDYLDQYFIVSTDMVGKSGVWGHFGSWDFSRADTWNKVNKGITEGVDEDTIYEIQTTDADKWVSGWPGYGSQIECNPNTNTSLICGNGLTLNWTGEKIVTNSEDIKYISFVNNQTEFVQQEVNSEGKLSLLLTPNKGVIISDNLLASSIFTKAFFFEGIGLDNFELFSRELSFNNQEILVYKVKLER